MKHGADESRDVAFHGLVRGRLSGNGRVYLSEQFSGHGVFSTALFALLEGLNDCRSPATIPANFTRVPREQVTSFFDKFSLSMALPFTPEATARFAHYPKNVGIVAMHGEWALEPVAGLARRSDRRAQPTSLASLWHRRILVR